jgi:hypothetical protein
VRFSKPHRSETDTEESPKRLQKKLLNFFAKRNFFLYLHPVYKPTSKSQ